MKRILARANVAIALILLPAMTGAATIAPMGDTNAEVSADLAGVALGAEPLGTASVTISDGGSSVFDLLFTEGTIDPGAAVIKLAGSGVSIFEIVLPVLNAGPGLTLDAPTEGAGAGRTEPADQCTAGNVPWECEQWP